VDEEEEEEEEEESGPTVADVAAAKHKSLSRAPYGGRCRRRRPARARLHIGYDGLAPARGSPGHRLLVQLEELLQRLGANHVGQGLRRHAHHSALDSPHLPQPMKLFLRLVRRGRRRRRRLLLTVVGCQRGSSRRRRTSRACATGRRRRRRTTRSRTLSHLFSRRRRRRRTRRRRRRRIVCLRAVNDGVAVDGVIHARRISGRAAGRSFFRAGLQRQLPASGLRGAHGAGRCRPARGRCGRRSSRAHSLCLARRRGSRRGRIARGISATVMMSVGRRQSPILAAPDVGRQPGTVHQGGRGHVSIAHPSRALDHSLHVCLFAEAKRRREGILVLFPPSGAFGSPPPPPARAWSSR